MACRLAQAGRLAARFDDHQGLGKLAENLLRLFAAHPLAPK
ncbi:hypothetical protein [Maritalea mediterranea]|nr:hypothetical protein [Maritalea mediterranea]